MLDENEIRWVKTTANELNNLIQVISDSSQLLQGLCAQTTEDHRYFSMLTTGVDRASVVIRDMVERIKSYEAGTAPLSTDPFPAPAPTPGLQSPDHIQIINPNGPRELILIVDDEELINLLAEHVLAEQGYRVVSAQDGFAAIEIYRKLQNQISLVILDFAMPVMNGGDVFDELLTINPKVPVVLSSGFTEHSKLSGMLAKGLRGFIPKPYSQDKLLEQVRTVLDSLEAEQTH